MVREDLCLPMILAQQGRNEAAAQNRHTLRQKWSANGLISATTEHYLRRNSVDTAHADQSGLQHLLEGSVKEPDHLLPRAAGATFGWAGRGFNI
jgi:hypothetical protein